MNTGKGRGERVPQPAACIKRAGERFAALHISRRTFLKTSARILGTAAVAPFGLALYQPHQIELSEVEIHLPRLPRALDGFRLAQLSDIHFGQFTGEGPLRKAVEMINSIRPDLMVATGDFATVPETGSRPQAAERAWPCAGILAGIQASHGRFAILGNHDHQTNAHTVAEALQTSGISVLRNRALPIERDGARLWLAGLDDVLAGRPDMPGTLRRIPKNECIILAVHEPDYADVASKQAIDMQISGHSHGGQIRFPVAGATYLPRLGRKYVMGRYRVGNLQLYTNRGLGVTLLPVRFLCPPEVAVFTLRAA